MSTQLGIGYGSESTLTITLNSLANGSAQQSTAITNTDGVDSSPSIGYDDILILLKIKTAASSVSSTGTVTVFIAGSLDGGTTYTGGASGSNASYTVNGNEIPLGIINANADATVYEAGPFSIKQAVGAVPQNWSIIVYNNTGAALDSSAGGSIQYQGTYTQTT